MDLPALIRVFSAPALSHTEGRSAVKWLSKNKDLTAEIAKIAEFLQSGPGFLCVLRVLRGKMTCFNGSGFLCVLCDLCGKMAYSAAPVFSALSAGSAVKWLCG